jgi:type I restriction enzyme R subunit
MLVTSVGAPPSPDELVARMGVTIDWTRWENTFVAGYHVDQVSRKGVRPYQDIAINKALWQFAQNVNRVLLLMATGTGKTFTIFQLVWKMLNGKALKREHILFLTDRNSLKDQAYRAFSALSAAERVQIDKDTVAQGQHQVGKVFFANYHNLDEELDGKKVYQHYDPDFFDLVVVDEGHRSGFGDWFGVLEYFGGALQLGLTATPRELEEGERALTDVEKRRDTQHYFGDPTFTYSLKQAIEDGYLVPYLLEAYQ